MKKSRISLLVFLGLTLSATHQVQAKPLMLDFIKNDAFKSNVNGQLDGSVQFAQTHTIDPNNNSEQEKPRLTSSRDALLLFMPKADNIKQLTATVYNRNGDKVGNVVMAAPDVLPRADRPTTLPDNKPDVRYAMAWSGELPWQWIQPGMTVTLTADGGRESRVSDIDVGPENQLTLQIIRVGMLTKPDSKPTQMEDTVSLVADYFQKIPVSTLKVGKYSPLYLEKVVMPDGTVYTNHSNSTGGVYDGDMRTSIAKMLISIGIDNANFGINSTDGDKQWQPQLFNIITIHRAVGNYTNGIQQHGLSGGNGIATLYDTIGNEFSHELGHNYELGHFPGGGANSAQTPDSGWGWDSWHYRFIANFNWNQGGDRVVEGYRVEPFADVYRFNADAMAGGQASSPLSNYTLYTPYSLKRIQQFFEKTGIQDPASSTGYSIWNASQGQMVEKSSEYTRKPEKTDVAVVTLVGFYDPQKKMPGYIYPALFGSLGNTFAAQPVGAGKCSVDVTFANGADVKYPVADRRLNSKVMNKFHINLERAAEPVRAEVQCDGQVLSAVDIGKPQVEPQPAVIVGKDAGYKQIIESTLTFKANDQLSAEVFKDVKSFEDELNVLYGNGEVKDWSGNRKGIPGGLYRYPTPYGISTEYFLLKKEKYGYFPTNQTSNDNWKYLGKTEDFVNLQPNPLDLLQSGSSSVSGFMADYYEAPKLYTWSARQKTVTDYGLFVYDNPYNKQTEYFLQKRAKQGWYFPTNEASNNDWIYLSSVENILNKRAGYVKQSAFEADYLQWLGQEAFGNWTGARKGVKGEIYAYNNPYSRQREYFRLKKTTYGYFPTNRTSNADWEYLGTWITPLNNMK